MTATVVNLRRVRKAKARVERANEAAAHRALHGRTRSEKTLQASNVQRTVRHLDGHRRDERGADASGTADRQADDDE